MSGERLTVECPCCGRSYETWAPMSFVLDADPQLGDPAFLEAAARTTCPHCGETACCGGLAAAEHAADWPAAH